MARRPRKNKFRKKFTKLMQKKLVLLFAGIVLAFALLVGRITYINAFNGDKYSKIVLDQQQYQSRMIPFKRGDIVDRNGTKLATSQRVYNVILDAKVMNSDEKYVDPTIQVLADCFGLDKSDVEDQVEENPNSRYLIMKKGVSYEKAQEFEKIDEDDENYPNVNGIWLEEDYVRTYPYNTLASDVIGFTVSGNVGSNGIEASYNSILNGTDGREYGYLSEDSSYEKTVKEAQNGDTVVSTIDLQVQSVVEKYITQFNEENRSGTTLGSKNTAVMVMNPQNGEIYACVNVPEFDLNEPFELNSGMDAEGMSEEKKQDLLNQMWRNPCLNDTYEPGSTFKIITMAAGLAEGVVSLNDSFYCPGYKLVEDRRIHCANRRGHGAQNFVKGAENSCNPVFIEVGLRLGADKYYQYFRQFGLMEKTGIDLPGEAGTIMHQEENMGEVELATVSFGQSFQITPIRLAATVSSLINGGTLITPHFGVAIESSDGETVKALEYSNGRKILDGKISETVRYILEQVVEEGSGRNAAVEGYRIGGKTATSQTLPRSANRYISSFLGFAPANDPKVLALCIIHDPQGIYYGGTIAAPVVRSIFENILPYLGVDKSDEKPYNQT